MYVAIPRNVDALRAALAVHDQAAVELMRQATRHMREARALARQLERIRPKRENQ
jgi:hypothetical protein